MKILVTGAKGQLGKKIAELLSADFELVLTDVDELDITDGESVEKFVNNASPDFIIHAAAYTQVDKAEENEELCRRINAEGTKNIATAAAKSNSTLIYISTDYVFDGEKDTPYNESDQPNPISVYARTKYEGEQYIEKICSKYFIIRSSWIFGELPENYAGTNFVETMLRLAKERDELNIVGDQIGSPTYTGDLVSVIKKIIQDTPDTSPNPPTTVPYGTYHFSGAGAASWYDFAAEIFRQKGINIKLNKITSDQYPQKAKRPAYSYLDKQKIEKALNIQVRSWQEMLKEYLNIR